MTTKPRGKPLVPSGDDTLLRLLAGVLAGMLAMGITMQVESRTGNRIVVSAPPNGNVAPPGPYLLFVNKRHSEGAIPSVSQQVFLRS